MECPFLVLRNSDGTQDIQDLSADNVVNVRPEAVIMTRCDKTVSGKWLHKSRINVRFWDTLCLQHQFCNYGHARCSNWPLSSSKHSKKCETIYYQIFPAWWASHDDPQHWMPGATDHNRSVRTHRSGIPARSWKNEMHWYITFWKLQTAWSIYSTNRMTNMSNSQMCHNVYWGLWWSFQTCILNEVGWLAQSV